MPKVVTSYVPRRASTIYDSNMDNFFDKYQCLTLNPKSLASILVRFCMRNIRLYLEDFECESPVPYSFKMFEEFVEEWHPSVKIESIYGGMLYCGSDSGNVISFLYSLVFDNEMEIDGIWMDNFIVHSCLLMIYDIIARHNIPVLKDVVYIIDQTSRTVNEKCSKSARLSWTHGVDYKMPCDESICPQLYKALCLCAKHDILKVQRDLVRIKVFRMRHMRLNT